MVRIVSLALIALAAPTLALAAPRQNCSPDWIPTFSGGPPGSNGIIDIVEVLDFGSGPELVAAGGFDRIGGVRAEGVATYDGDTWRSLGLGFEFGTEINAFETYDDGSGVKLYACGLIFLPGGERCTVARWENGFWRVAPGLRGSIARRGDDLAVFDDGTGPKLYCLGQLNPLGGGEINGVAVYSGAGWSNALDGEIVSSLGFLTRMEVFNDGTGSALFLGGPRSIYITSPTGFVLLDGISKVVGRDVEAVADWPGYTPGEFVTSMVVHDRGAGPELYVNAQRGVIGGTGPGFAGIRSWNGTQWTDLGRPGDDTSLVFDLAVFDNGTGPELYAGGHFGQMGGAQINQVARFDGAAWVAAGDAIEGGPQPTCYSLAAGDVGSGEVLFVGGFFEVAGNTGAKNLAQFDGVEWLPTTAPTESPSAWVRALAEFDEGSGLELYAGGMFASAGSDSVGSIARWDGSSWSALQDGMATVPGRGLVVEALEVFDDGSGESLFAGGSFLSAGGVSVNGIARWDGTQWHDVGGGVTGALPSFPTLSDPLIVDFEVFDDGNGPALYVAGHFAFAGGGPASGVARWDGTAWSPLGSGASISSLGLVERVQSLAVFDDGVNGPELYAAGAFSSMDGVAGTSRLARWNGTEWRPVGTGGTVRTAWLLSAVDEGNGPILLIAGRANFPGGPTTELLYQWNGQQFAPRDGTGLPASDLGEVTAITTYDDGTGQGPRTVVAGVPFSAGAAPLQVIFMQDGNDWIPLSSTGPQGGISHLVVHNDGTGFGPCLFAGGAFDQSSAGIDSYLARFGGCAEGAVGQIYCVSEANSTGAIARISAFGTQDLASNNLTLSAEAMPTNVAGIFITSRDQGSVSAPAPFQGVLCLGGSVGRYQSPGQVQHSGALGEFELSIDWTLMPQPLGAISAMAGETWNFQAWYRDMNPSPTANFTSAISVLLR